MKYKSCSHSNVNFPGNHITGAWQAFNSTIQIRWSFFLNKMLIFSPAFSFHLIFFFYMELLFMPEKEKHSTTAYLFCVHGKKLFCLLITLIQTTILNKRQSRTSASHHILDNFQCGIVIMMKFEFLDTKNNEVNDIVGAQQMTEMWNEQGRKKTGDINK